MFRSVYLLFLLREYKCKERDVQIHNKITVNIDAEDYPLGREKKIHIDKYQWIITNIRKNQQTNGVTNKTKQSNECAKKRGHRPFIK